MSKKPEDTIEEWLQNYENEARPKDPAAEWLQEIEQPQQRKRKAQIITTAVIKGGTGKTTTAAALAQAAAFAGKKVLAIDLDPQANFSFFIGADQNAAGSFQLLTGAADAGQLIQQTEQGIDAIAASPDLATIRTTPGSAKRLQRAIEPLKKEYDFIFIDTPPQMGELTYNALQASTGLLVPLETDNSSLQGLYQVVDIANQIHHSNPELSIMGTILTKYEGHINANKYMRDVIAEKGQEIGAPLLLEIRKGTAIREAQLFQQSIYKYAPRSNPARDYNKLFQIITQED